MNENIQVTMTKSEFNSFLHMKELFEEFVVDFTDEEDRPDIIDTHEDMCNVVEREFAKSEGSNK